ncbi:MAG: CtsR family transcriptional regulator [Clostridia bacterium]|nr:CtsR family transcriptional regulator [Clostridia bacterium]
MRLSDTIEEFIKTMMREDQEACELKRNELAEYFHCAPSQINYVLSTRFTPDHGYSITSQRGGGGYVRIVRIQASRVDRLTYYLNERIGDSIDEQRAQIICRQLKEKGTISDREAEIMSAAVSRGALGVPVPEDLKNVLRARILKSMLIASARQRPAAPDSGAGEE